MNPFKTIYQVEKDGRIFTLHWKYRFDPVTIAMGAMAVGTGMQVVGGIRQGKMAEKLGKQRAAIDRMKAEQAWENSKTQAEILAEKRERLVASNTNKAAASGIRINSPAVLNAEEETRRIINADISNILNQGRQGKTNFMQSAEYEKALGKSQKQQSYWDAAGTGLTGAGSIALMGYDRGFWGGDKMKTSLATQLRY